jgi:hypothetical protein
MFCKLDREMGQESNLEHRFAESFNKKTHFARYFVDYVQSFRHCTGLELFYNSQLRGIKDSPGFLIFASCINQKGARTGI